MTPLIHLKYTLQKLLFIGLLYSSMSIGAQEEKTSIQNEYKGTIAEKVKTKFNKPEIEIEKSGLVSNVLKIINTSNENLNFSLDVLLPNDWNSIVDSSKYYNLPNRDTIIIPILLIPSKVNTGSSEIIINAFLLDLDGQQIGDNSFILRTKKKIRWDLEVKTANKFYFKNDEFSKQFEYRILNKGNYQQDITVDYLIPKKDLFLSDTANIENKILNKNSIRLEVGEEADFTYSASAIRLDERNQKKISNTDYTPYQNKYFKKYDLVINSTEDKNSSDRLYKKTAKVSFIKLPNEIEMQPYGYPSIPITIDMYIQNILSDYPFMSISLRGIKQLNDEASLVYNTNLNFSKSYYTGNSDQDIPWYLGYFDDYKSIEIGQVYSNIIGIPSTGKGIRGSYRIGDHNSIAGFFIKSNASYQNTDNQSYGITHTFYSSIFSLKTQVGRNENTVLGRDINIISINPKLRINKLNTINFYISKSIIEDKAETENKVGYLYGASISTAVLKNVKTTIYGRYSGPNFGTGTIERLNFSHKTNYRINDNWSTYLNNNYQETKTPITSNLSPFYKQKFLFNRFSLAKKTPFGSVQNGVYYDYKNYLDTKIKSRGLSYRISSYTPKKNLQTSLLVRAGYTKEILDTPTNEVFSFDFTTLTRYRIWNFTLKYNYGNFSTNPTQTTEQEDITPQMFRFSIQNQYTFKNRRLILETNGSYTYRNIAKNNSFGFHPELFYFSKTNWRYSLQMSYFFNSTDYTDFYNFDDENTFTTSQNTKIRNSNLTIGMSIRKEFGIPIPFIKNKSSNIEFIAFKDTNGNGVKDKHETPVNNVVITFDTREVITTSTGVAKINKTPYGKYPLKILPLEEIEGWFPNVSDSIYIGQDEKYFIPFVKGVKLYGDVIIDRQKIAMTDDKPIDLSRIKISATREKTYNTLTDENGHFEFYLPNGDYILTMDADILSSNLRLSRNNIPVVLKNNQDGYYISFYILEKRRKVIIRDFSKKKK